MQFGPVANKHAAFLRLTVDIFKKEEKDRRLGKGVYSTYKKASYPFIFFTFYVAALW